MSQLPLSIRVAIRPVIRMPVPSPSVVALLVALVSLGPAHAQDAGGETPPVDSSGSAEASGSGGSDPAARRERSEGGDAVERGDPSTATRDASDPSSNASDSGDGTTGGGADGAATASEPSIEALEARLAEQRRQLEAAEAMQRRTEEQVREIESALDDQARRERALEAEVEALCRRRDVVEPGSFAACLEENRASR